MKREYIKLSKLILSDDNPRLELYDNTIDILREMLSDQQDKLFTLAEDILINGLSPLDLWAVYPADNHKFKVAEGNRRLSAIMILNNIELIKDIDPRIYRRFLNLLNSSTTTPPQEIECVIFEKWDDPKLQHWIQLRHLGLNRGKGIDAWDSVQKSRYEQSLFGVNALIDFWQELIDKDILTEMQISSISKTNWIRILNLKGRTYLGLGKNKTNYLIPRDKKNYVLFTERIKKIAEMLANQTVGIVYDNEKIIAFLNEVNIALYGVPIKERPNNHSDQLDLPLNDVTDNPPLSISPYTTPPQPTDERSEALSDSTKIDKPKSYPFISNVPPRDLFNNCKTVIPYSYPIRSSNHRINIIIRELKSLEVDKFQNACGSLCRLLFELSAKHYIEINISNKDETETEFMDALSQASNHLIKTGKITKATHSALSRDKDNLRLLFNGYMHKTNMYPSSSTIKNLFKAHKEFIERCLEK